MILFDDDEQLEVRHVISLAHHDVSIYSGEEVIPEGELWIKRNAICLTRRQDGLNLGLDTQPSKPFFLFSENCSAKEDFYFALLRNQEQTFAAENKVFPTPIQFDVKHIISLVQKLHSSEEHLQTRWLNAMIGRVFLGIHKTKDAEIFIREKLTKKISRVKRPSFLSNIAIKSIDTGESAPYFTKPRLKDLTIEGECTMESDVRYTGNFRLEVAATARIDLGSRFKPREVNLVLAVVVRKLEGRTLFKIKPPPSNRIWYSFQQMPKLEMTIEPIVSSRQITYTVILRQIENRIKEIIAETIVLPFWDDTPFFNTEHKRWRGGIFHDDSIKSPSNPEPHAPPEKEITDGESLEAAHATDDTEQVSSEKFLSDKSGNSPLVEKKATLGLFAKKLSSKDSKTDLLPTQSSYSSTLPVSGKNDAKSEGVMAPPVLSATFQPSTPTVGTVPAIADQFKPSSSPPNRGSAALAMATLTAKSQSLSLAQGSNPNAYKPYVTSKSSSRSGSSSSFQETNDAENALDRNPQLRQNTSSSSETQHAVVSQSTSWSSLNPTQGQTKSLGRSVFSHRETVLPISSGSSLQVTPEVNKKSALSAVANAAASAKRWGINAFQRRANDTVINPGQKSDQASAIDLSQPMGRGQPLPPPGTPLPMPDRKTSVTPIPVPKWISKASSSMGRETESAGQSVESHSVPPPLLPRRRQFYGEAIIDPGLLVVAAPSESEPISSTNGSYSPSCSMPLPGNDQRLDGSSNDVNIATSQGAGPDQTLDNAAEALNLERKATIPNPVGDDDDEYSAWTDNMELGEGDAPANGQ